MTYLTHSEALKDRFLSEFQTLLSNEVETRLRALLQDHLRGRKVRFIDAMGSSTIDISSRWGKGYYVITADSIWHSGEERIGWSYLGERPPQFLKDVQNLIQDYIDMADNLVAVEFKLEFP